jgi:hypothetical protein
VPDPARTAGRASATTRVVEGVRRQALMQVLAPRRHRGRWKWRSGHHRWPPPLRGWSRAPLRGGWLGDGCPLSRDHALHGHGDNVRTVLNSPWRNRAAAHQRVVLLDRELMPRRRNLGSESRFPACWTGSAGCLALAISGDGAHIQCQAPKARRLPHPEASCRRQGARGGLEMTPRWPAACSSVR